MPTCLECGSPIPIEEEMPEVGDIIICPACGAEHEVISRLKNLRDLKGVFFMDRQNDFNYQSNLLNQILVYTCHSGLEPESSL
jgi:lysine biosynthesis protein LysW